MPGMLEDGHLEVAWSQKCFQMPSEGFLEPEILQTAFWKLPGARHALKWSSGRFLKPKTWKCFKIVFWRLSGGRNTLGINLVTSKSERNLGPAQRKP